MSSNSGSEPDSLRVSDESAAVLLARATQLDAARLNQVSISELRQAARDAGIAPEAFEQALSEFRAAAAVSGDKPVTTPRFRRYWIASLALIATFLAYVFVLRAFPG